MTERQIHTLLRLNYNDEEHGVIHLFGDFEQTINPTFIQLESIETLYMIMVFQTIRSKYYHQPIAIQLQFVRSLKL